MNLPDGTILYQLITFLIVMFILSKLLFKPISHNLEERNKAIFGTLEGVEGKKKELEGKIARYDRIIENVRREVASMFTAARKEAEEERKTIVERVKENSSRIIEEARERIKIEELKARESLKEQVKTFSKRITEKILGKTVY